ncbi:hypothetical protein P9B29_006633, partial [Pseudomonas aeruginosa]|uniref:hypothetical protein n=1 Tax=Pseudomonas aeruginosa TaxID=287 RepID=UPI00384E24AE
MSSFPPTAEQSKQRTPIAPERNSDETSKISFLFSTTSASNLRSFELSTLAEIFLKELALPL